MKICVVVCASLLMFAHESRAQAEVGVGGSALISIQPIDDAYVGDPYLSAGIGGLGPGFAIGANAITRSGFSAAFEYTTAWFERRQTGRLVRGPFPLESVPATTRLRDSLVSVLAGYAIGRSTRVMLLAGISVRLDRPTIDGVEAEKYDSDEGVLPAITGGVDVLHPLSSRVQFVINGRYTFNERDTRQQYLGIGTHIIRAGAGIRIK